MTQHQGTLHCAAVCTMHCHGCICKTTIQLSDCFKIAYRCYIQRPLRFIAAFRGPAPFSRRESVGNSSVCFLNLCIGMPECIQHMIHESDAQVVQHKILTRLHSLQDVAHNGKLVWAVPLMVVCLVLHLQLVQCWCRAAFERSSLRRHSITCNELITCIQSKQC